MNESKACPKCGAPVLYSGWGYIYECGSVTDMMEDDGLSQSVKCIQANGQYMKRYTPYWSLEEMAEKCDGEYVLFSDHQQSIERLQAENEQLDKQIDFLSNVVNREYTNGEAEQKIAEQAAEIDRLNRVIESLTTSHRGER